MNGVVAGYNSDSIESASLDEGLLFIMTAVFGSVLLIGLFLLLKKFVSDPVKRLSASMEKVSGGDLSVTMEAWVADNGPLIEEGLKDQLFEPFHAGATSYNRKGGNGLGLSVAKKIARLHDGDLEYRERLSEGYKGFVLTLPR